jgi:ankyrin repeat protein
MCADVDGKVPLIEALIARDIATVKLLWENGATLNNADRGRFLGQAVMDGNTGLIDDLLQYGADVNEGDTEGLTPLHVAVMNGHLDMVKFLLSRGAVVNKFDDRIPSPLQLADLNKEHPEMAALLKSQAVLDSSIHGQSPVNNTSDAEVKLGDDQSPASLPSCHPGHDLDSGASGSREASMLNLLNKGNSVEFDQVPTLPSTNSLAILCYNQQMFSIIGCCLK